MAQTISEDRRRIFEDYPVPKAVLTMSIPTICSSLVMIFYNLADTYFVGLLNNPIQNAAVTLAAPLLLAFNAVTNLFGVGCSSLMSRSIGKKDYEKVKHTSAFGFYGAFGCALLYSLIYFLFKSGILGLLGAGKDTLSATSAYLFWTVGLGAVPSIINVVMSNLVRSEGYSLQASIGTMSGCILNVILDPFFILPWGLNMGASGAGLATMIGNSVACIYFLIILYIRRHTTLLSLKPTDFSLDKEIVGDVCSVGIPASIQNLLNVAGMTILNNFSAGYGADAVAAMGICHKVSQLPLYVSMGMAQGIMPLISFNYSAKNGRRMKDVILFTVKIAGGFMIIVALLLSIFSGPVTGFFIQTESIINYGHYFLRGMSLAMPFLALDFLGVAVFQSCGMGKLSFFFAVARKILLEIPALFILNYFFPLYGLAYAQLCAEVVLAVAAVIVLKRIFDKV